MISVVAASFFSAKAMAGICTQAASKRQTLNFRYMLLVIFKPRLFMAYLL
jgi:hypothetical protein